MRYHVEPVGMAIIKKGQVSASIQSKENTFILLLGKTNGAATMENNMEDFPGGPVVENSRTNAGVHSFASCLLCDVAQVTKPLWVPISLLTNIEIKVESFTWVILKNGIIMYMKEHDQERMWKC